MADAWDEALGQDDPHSTQAIWAFQDTVANSGPGPACAPAFGPCEPEAAPAPKRSELGERGGAISACGLVGGQVDAPARVAHAATALPDPGRVALPPPCEEVPWPARLARAAGPWYDLCSEGAPAFQPKTKSQRRRMQKKYVKALEYVRSHPAG